MDISLENIENDKREIIRADNTGTLGSLFAGKILSWADHLERDPSSVNIIIERMREVRAALKGTIA